VLICQLETPFDATIEALKMFKGLSILNVAPAVKNLPAIAFTIPTILCANELEAEEITGIKFDTIQDAKKMIEAFLEKGCKTVIVTLGKNGAVFNDVERRIIHVPVQKSIQAVDTTGNIFMLDEVYLNFIRKKTNKN
jgi:ribokinase